VKSLVDGGADPYIQNNVGHDAIYEAELNDKREAVEWMLKEGDLEGLEGEGAEGEADGEGSAEAEGQGEGEQESLKEQLEKLDVGGEDKGKGKERAE
jgi:hypothetical protein